MISCFVKKMIGIIITSNDDYSLVEGLVWQEKVWGSGHLPQEKRGSLIDTLVNRESPL